MEYWYYDEAECYVPYTTLMVPGIMSMSVSDYHDKYCVLNKGLWCYSKKKHE